MFHLRDIVLRNLKKLLYLVGYYISSTPLDPCLPYQGPHPPVVPLRWRQEAQSRLPCPYTHVCRLLAVLYVLFHGVHCTNNKPFAQLSKFLIQHHSLS